MKKKTQKLGFMFFDWNSRLIASLTALQFNQRRTKRLFQFLCLAWFCSSVGIGVALPSARVSVQQACISPADINAEETLSTLKYANRAHNIQNKPIVNRDRISNEMQRMHQQLEYLQAELLCARGGGTSSDEVQTGAYVRHVAASGRFQEHLLWAPKFARSNSTESTLQKEDLTPIELKDEKGALMFMTPTGRNILILLLVYGAQH